MWQIIRHSQPEGFVIATGESHTLREFVETAFACLGLDWHEHVRIDEKLLRPTDIRYSVGCADKARPVLGWQARTRMTGIVEALMAAELEARGLVGPGRQLMIKPEFRWGCERVTTPKLHAGVLEDYKRGDSIDQ